MSLVEHISPQWNVREVATSGMMDMISESVHPWCKIILGAKLFDWNWVELMNWPFFEIGDAPEISKSQNIYNISILVNWTVAHQKLKFIHLYVCAFVFVCVCTSFRTGYLICGCGSSVKWKQRLASCSKSRTNVPLKVLKYTAFSSLHSFSLDLSHYPFTI